MNSFKNLLLSNFPIAFNVFHFVVVDVCPVEFHFELKMNRFLFLSTLRLNLMTFSFFLFVVFSSFISIYFFAVSRAEIASSRLSHTQQVFVLVAVLRSIRSFCKSTLAHLSFTLSSFVVAYRCRLVTLRKANIHCGFVDVHANDENERKVEKKKISAR